MSDIRIRIDTRFFRLTIYRQALKAIGNPPFIYLGYQPETRRLMIMGSWVDDRKSIRVHYDSPTIYVFSAALLRGIRQVSRILMEEGSYSVEGEAYSTEAILIFPLGNAEMSPEAGKE